MDEVGKPGPVPSRAGRSIRFRCPAGRRCPTDRAAGAQLQIVIHVDKAGVFQRLPGGIDAIDDERIDLALDLVIDALARVEAVFVIRRLHFAGDQALLARRVELRDRPRAGFAGQQVFPHGFNVGPQRVTRPSPVTTTRRMIFSETSIRGPGPSLAWHFHAQQAQTLAG
jgi:hypothetical protein